MTDLRNAAKDVLDELDGMRDGRYSVFLGVSPANRESLREALATPIEDTPAAWGMLSKGVIVDAICPAEHDREEGDYTVALYRNPPARELTEAEITALSIKPENYPRHAFARAVIKAAKEVK